MKTQETIKRLRTERGWSQEQMAERLNVSRQAITKWETGAGSPDIENIAAIAQLFGVSTDELIFGETTAQTDESGVAKPFESLTSLDLSNEKHYDVHVGCARTVTLRATEGEKAVVRLTSEGISDLERAFKVELDTSGRNLDIDVTSTGLVADALARRELDVVIELPSAYSADAEVELFADELHVEGARFDLEVDGKVGRIWLTDVDGHVELDIPMDLEVWAKNARGRLDVNQMGATSTVHVVGDTSFFAETKGRLGKRTLRFTRNGEPCEAPTVEDPQLKIELAGARCELTVDAMA